MPFFVQIEQLHSPTVPRSARMRNRTRPQWHTFCRHCGIHAFYVPRSDPDQISVNARCLDEIDVAALQPSRFFDGRNWEAAFAARQASGS